jgi:hypothetical protein
MKNPRFYGSKKQIAIDIQRCDEMHLSRSAISSQQSALSVQPKPIAADLRSGTLIKSQPRISRINTNEYEATKK